ncbi:MAG: SpoVA/SpoVAEb family sporulation membrane protein [Clostridia bacterium]|nr:SpoVA/SpoVAEb family sporulation membrane protein [Clostridia bacterium]
MDIEKKTYKKYADAHAPRSPLLRDCVFAFLFGGGICVLAQGLVNLYGGVFGASEETAGTLSSVTLIFIAALLSAIGVFDNVARFAGAGTLVPITGFANAVVSPAIDSRAEGFVLGVGAKIFTVAGPVLLYAVLSGAVTGTFYYLYTLIF